MSEIVNKVIPIDQLKPHPRNYKLHPEKQIGRLRASVARFGQVRSVVAQEGANGKFLLVAGHGLTKAAREEGLNELRVDVIPADWTPEQVEGYLVADNLLGATAEDDNTLLAEILQEQANLDYDLASLGSSRRNLTRSWKCWPRMRWASCRKRVGVGMSSIPRQRKGRLEAS
jgi:ParB-like chromosome segregation protein Spo0J